ncbi:hypothetical protein NDU88_004821 [Pleurodeles waltl]|uniref:Uncharacterized protein n=1 Tax=Pleurodeles waltl TaxID=8319 RepID=A0AAV7W7T2_PLEWA|nr:hypothetical protein NDU88_004821 [Pleurodeles waltl]
MSRSSTAAVVFTGGRDGTVEAVHYTASEEVGLEEYVFSVNSFLFFFFSCVGFSDLRGTVRELMEVRGNKKKKNTE